MRGMKTSQEALLLTTQGLLLRNKRVFNDAHRQRWMGRWNWRSELHRRWLLGLLGRGRTVCKQNTRERFTMFTFETMFARSEKEHAGLQGRSQLNAVYRRSIAPQLKPVLVLVSDNREAWPGNLQRFWIALYRVSIVNKTNSDVTSTNLPVPAHMTGGTGSLLALVARRVKRQNTRVKIWKQTSWRLKTRQAYLSLVSSS